MERIRFERLQAVCTRALQESIKKSLDIEKIKKCYPTLASSEEGVKALEIARSQIIEFWLNNSLKEFELIFKERDIENKLNSLDDLIQLAKERSLSGSKPIQIDKLTPKEIIAANIDYKKRQTIKSLKLMYDQLIVDNNELFDELTAIGKESEAIKSDIERNFTSINKELGVINGGVDDNIDKLLDTVVNEL